MSVDLALLQRQLAEVVRGNIPEPADGYIETVAASTGMQVMRDVIASWREAILRPTIPITSRLLDLDGRLAEALAALRPRCVSAFPDVFAASFLTQFVDDADPLVAAAASFERAVMLVRLGEADRIVVTWPHDPEEVVGRLASQLPLDGLERGSFETVVCANT